MPTDLNGTWRVHYMRDRRFEYIFRRYLNKPSKKDVGTIEIVIEKRIKTKSIDVYGMLLSQGLI